MSVTTPGPTVVRRDPVDATPLPRRSREPERTATAETLLIVGVLLAWLVGYLLVFSGFQHGHAQQRLYDHLRTQLALGEAPTAAPIAAGEPVALVSLRGLRDEVVVEGTTPALLQKGVGHVSGSVLPGQAGVSVLMGRSLTFGAPFRRLAEVRPGDPLVVRTQQGRFTYRVSGLRRPGDPVPAALPTGSSRLVLVTGWGQGLLNAGTTLFVDATLQGSAVPAGAVGPFDADGAAMATDTSLPTLALLALSLQLLVVAVLGIVWARARWSTTGAWVAGSPVVLAALWIVSTVAARLLPNLL